MLLQLVWQQCQTFTGSPRAATSSNSSDVQPWDQLRDHQGQQNLWLEVMNQTNRNPLTQNLASYYYFRANYLWYPHRLRVTTTDLIINHGWEFLQTNEIPTAAWCAQNQITGQVIYDLNQATVWPDQVMPIRDPSEPGLGGTP